MFSGNKTPIMSEKEHIKLHQEIRQQCREPFPQEALSVHGSKSFLTSIKAQYVIERLNDIFGLCGWDYEHEIVSDAPDYVCMKGRLVFKEYSLSTPFQYGGHKKSGTGTEAADGYKSAVTDGITKCASLIEIGNDVFKGLVKPPKQSNQNSYKKKAIPKKTEKPSLIPDTEEWKKAIHYLAFTEGASITTIKVKYSISPKNESYLMSKSLDESNKPAQSEMKL